MKPIQRILVGVELTDPSRAVLEEAALLAGLLGAELQLLHAIPEDGPGAAGLGVQARSQLDRLEAYLKEADIRVGTSLLPGGTPPAEALLRAIDAERPDLVVLGAGAKSRLDRLLLGATAERVVRSSPRPVWLARPFARHAAIKTIACAVDASAPAREALAAAVFLARTFVAELLLVSILPPPELPHRGGATEQGFRDAIASIDLHGVQHQVVLHVAKDAADGIVEVLGQRRADLLVLGAARRSGLARAVLGNTSERVLRRVPCSVLTVPAE